METAREEWRDVPGYEGYYQASNLGRIRSLDRYVKHRYGGYALRRGSVKKLHFTTSDRVTITLHKNGKPLETPVARVVYAAFNGPIPEGMQVNHIDENPLNNCIENLNLMTPKENTNWGTCIERRSKKMALSKKGKHLYGNNPNARKIKQYTLDGSFLQEWDSIKTAADYYGVTTQNIRYNLIKKHKTAAGFRWEYSA